MRKKTFSWCAFLLLVALVFPCIFAVIFSWFNWATSHASIAAFPSQSTPQAATLLINEYLADPPAGSAGDANGDGVTSSTQDEFVEIVNYGLLPINIGGFTLSDASQVRFTFPTGKIVPAGEAAVVFGGGHPSGAFGNAMMNGLVFASSGLSLNNGGDTLIIKDASGMLVDSRTYPSADGSANQSITRSPDVSGNFVRHATATGSGMALYSPGTRVNGTTFSDGPRITRLSPDQILQSNSPFALAVQGNNFSIGALVYVDFIALPTTFNSSANLTATVPVSIASTAGKHFVEVVNQDGNHSNGAFLNIISPPPELFSITPRLVEIGIGSFTLIVQGNHFTPLSKVLIEGSLMTTFFSGTRQLFVTVPASFTNTVGVRRVQVRNDDGNLSAELSFEVIAKNPRIISLNPLQTIAGSPAFTLTVNGANFTSGAVVSFQQTLLDTKFLSASVLLAEVPAALIADIGLKSVVVQSGGGALSNESPFRVSAAAPLLNSIAPNAAIEGSPEQALVISGTGFKRGAVVRALGTSQITSLDTTFISAEQLAAKLPASLLQTATNLALQVENPDFGLSIEIVFKVFIKDPLVINEYLADPPDGLAGDANGDGARSSSQDEFIEIVNRTDVAKDLSGYALADADGVRHVFASATIIPPFEAAVVFGGGNPQGRFGNAMENGLVFTASTGGLSLNNGGDTIKLIDPAGNLVQEIKFGVPEGNASQSINRNPDIDGAVFSNHQRVTGFDKLFSPGAKATGEAFTIKPVITALSPTSVQARSADFSLLLSGENFQPGALVIVKQNFLPALYHSESELEVRFNDELLLDGGTFDIQVQNPKGEISGKAKFVIRDDPPQLHSITPSQTGTGAQNLEITIQGDRLQRGAAVMIANEKVETRFIQTRATAALVAIAPEKFFTVARDLEIRVLNADGNLSNLITLRVENGPLITRVSRTKFKAGQGTIEITFSGVAFRPDIVLFVGNEAVQTTFLNETSFAARLPAAMTEKSGQLMLQARHPDGGRSNRLTIKIVE
ncbi:MAG: lamin tail domain-containing protein [Acidobacteria bacterium]|nr:lamin tail domain-containing protein [Acidobacteriota bacterium]